MNEITLHTEPCCSNENTEQINDESVLSVADNDESNLSDGDGVDLEIPEAENRKHLKYAFIQGCNPISNLPNGCYASPSQIKEIKGSKIIFIRFSVDF